MPNRVMARRLLILFIVSSPFVFGACGGSFSEEGGLGDGGSGGSDGGSGTDAVLSSDGTPKDSPGLPEALPPAEGGETFMCGSTRCEESVNFCVLVTNGTSVMSDCYAGPCKTGKEYCSCSLVEAQAGASASDPSEIVKCAIVNDNPDQCTIGCMVEGSTGGGDASTGGEGGTTGGADGSPPGDSGTSKHDSSVPHDAAADGPKAGREGGILSDGGISL